ncbi:glycosyl transferase [Bernardetia litoralis DSM 6794]|uniref:Glycosyl transferase n=1 Tax=Bernardetia litoralis (strain ATCC 23117 / DSM 6794 / NBRC 15988 / NCIMB 1366 / Fx l1 / Sio-4) TaxID=880071 RepID=I4AG53_BERLS|nr:glycosyltransferase family 2 protein [Bernardetia litoralis]AFM02938.1 glycosyl transferase [Bernardetia litoralis DSM 6794]
MKISIITVVRNAKELFLQTLESVKNQTYQNIEYVVVDGNSTDGTKEIIEQNQEFISTWISEKDESLYDAMNKGLKLSTGDFVWFLHAGDTIPTSQTLENVINDILEKNKSENQSDNNSFQNIDFIYGKVKIESIENDISTFSDYHKIAPTEKELAKKGYKNFLEGMVICHQAMLVRREIAPFYDLDFRLAGDIDWSIRLFKEIEKRKKNKEEVRVRQSEIIIAHFLAGGISTSQKKKSLQERFKIFQKHIGFVGTVWQHFIIFGKRVFK